MDNKFLVVNRGQKKKTFNTLDELGYKNDCHLTFPNNKFVLYLDTSNKKITGWDYFKDNYYDLETTLEELDDREKVYYKVETYYNNDGFVCTGPDFAHSDIKFQTAFDIGYGEPLKPPCFPLSDIESIYKITEEEAKTLMVVPTKVKLNDDYTAEVYSDRIDIGCQTFTMKQFDKFVDAVNKVRHK